MAFDQFTVGPIRTPTVDKLIEWTFVEGIPLMFDYIAGFLKWETMDFEFPYIGFPEQELAIGVSGVFHNAVSLTIALSQDQSMV